MGAGDGMTRAAKWLWKQLLDVLPTCLFFFVVFSFRSLTDSLLYGKQTIHSFQLLELALLSLAAGKVFVLVDHLPFVRAFADRALLYDTFWRTFLYSLAGLLYRGLDVLIELWRKYGGLGAALGHYGGARDWTRFWGVQIWLTVVLLLYVAARGFVRSVGGRPVVRRVFLAPRHRPA